jgi:hypothetical protein
LRLDEQTVLRDARPDQPLAAGLGFGKRVALPDAACHDDPADSAGPKQLGSMPQSLLEHR